MALVWIAVALVFALVEVASVALYAAFLAAGAVAAAVAAFGGTPPLGQALVFGLVSLLGVLFVRRPLLDHLRARHHPDLLSGAWAMIGQTALVVDPIVGPHQRGHVRIAGEDWPALSADGSPVERGATVRVVDIRQATLVVDPAPQQTGVPTTTDHESSGPGASAGPTSKEARGLPGSLSDREESRWVE